MGESANLFVGLGNLFSGGAELVSAASQASSMNALGEYQARMGEMNAELSTMAAVDAEKRGEKDVTRLRKKAETLRGQQVTNLVGQGVDITVGTAREIAINTERDVALDEITLKNNAWREAMGFKVQAMNQRFQGQADQMAMNTKASATLLTGGLSAAKSFLAGGKYLGEYGKDISTPKTKTTTTTSQKKVGGGRRLPE